MPQESILGSNTISTEIGNITCKDLFDNLEQGNTIRIYTLSNDNTFVTRHIVKFGKIPRQKVSEYHFLSNGLEKFVNITDYAEIFIINRLKKNFLNLVENDEIMTYNHILKYSLDLNSSYEKKIMSGIFKKRIIQDNLQDTYFFKLENNLPLIIENSFFITLPISEIF